MSYWPLVCPFDWLFHASKKTKKKNVLSDIYLFQNMYIDTSSHPPLVIYLSEICLTLHWCTVPFDCIEWCELNRLFFLDEVTTAQWLCHPFWSISLLYRRSNASSDRWNLFAVDALLPLIEVITKQLMYCSSWSKLLLQSGCTAPSTWGHWCTVDILLQLIESFQHSWCTVPSNRCYCCTVDPL